MKELFFLFIVLGETLSILFAMEFIIMIYGTWLAIKENNTHTRENLSEKEKFIKKWAMLYNDKTYDNHIIAQYCKNIIIKKTKKSNKKQTVWLYLSCLYYFYVIKCK